MRLYLRAVEQGSRQVTVLNNLAWLLAENPASAAPVLSIDVASAKAVELARQAVAATGGSDVRCLYTLALASAAAGQGLQAQAAARQALELIEQGKADPRMRPQVEALLRASSAAPSDQ